GATERTPLRLEIAAQRLDAGVEPGDVAAQRRAHLGGVLVRRFQLALQLQDLGGALVENAPTGAQPLAQPRLLGARRLRLRPRALRLALRLRSRRLRLAQSAPQELAVVLHLFDGVAGGLQGAAGVLDGAPGGFQVLTRVFRRPA